MGTLPQARQPPLDVRWHTFGTVRDLRSNAVGTLWVDFAGMAQLVSDTLTLIDSYHCSRYNTNTGRLTPQMFRDVFTTANALLD